MPRIVQRFLKIPEFSLDGFFYLTRVLFLRKRYEDAVKKQKKKQQEDEMKKPVTANRS